MTSPLHTPDGRYIIVRGRLWRATNPNLDDDQREAAVRALMNARRALRGNGDAEARAQARQQVDEAKRVLGERGPVWWVDGAPDLNRKLVRNTPYAEWYATLSDVDGETKTPG